MLCVLPWGCGAQEGGHRAVEGYRGSLWGWKVQIPDCIMMVLYKIRGISIPEEHEAFYEQEQFKHKLRVSEHQPKQVQVLPSTLITLPSVSFNCSIALHENKNKGESSTQ